MVTQLSEHHWRYYTEGGANVLFKSDTQSSQLLRLRKYKPGSPSTHEIYQFIRSQLVDLHSYMASVELVAIDKSLLVSLNQDPGLKDKNILDTTEQFGLLVDFVGLDHGNKVINLSGCTIQVSRTGDNVDTKAIIEFKPKWLIQSPTAPKDAKYCRTCAVRRMRGKPESFCPLDLVATGDKSYQSHRLERALSQLVEGYDGDLPLVRELLSYFQNSNILDTLKRLQSLDTKGVLRTETVDEGFNIAMTCRDVTMLVEIEASQSKQQQAENNYKVDCRLIDLDLKRYKGAKLQYLIDIENELISKWYL